jgi:hypothetical protein
MVSRLPYPAPLGSEVLKLKLDALNRIGRDFSPDK